MDRWMATEQVEELWGSLSGRETVAVIALKLGRAAAAINERVRDYGGGPPPRRQRAAG